MPDAYMGVFSMQRVEAEVAVSVSDLKKSPSSVIEKAHGQPVAVLNHNRVMAYLVRADVYERIMDLLDDQELARIVQERQAAGEKPVKALIVGDDIAFDDD